MGIKVLVVDDSVFFRRRVSEILNSHPQLEVIDTANNGKEALEKVQQLRPDVVTMDIEMPVMNGIDAAREIMRVRPTPILMFSSLTHEGAKATLDALDAGAVDFLPKKFEDIARDREEAITLLQQRVISISRHRVRPLLSQRPATSSLSASRTPATSNSATPLRAAAPAAENRPVRPAALNTRRSGKVYQLVAIGTSTGGPVALQNILTKLPGNFPHPILLIQHMPATFTAAFASRLNNLCQINVKEAADGDVVQPGTAYLAPGGKQMVLDGRPGAMRIRILDGGERMNYKPCVDITFASCARQYRDKVLAVVLTGMGADGRDGAKLLHEQGATIWAQDEESCVVYGMPQAIVKAGIAAEILPLERVAQRIMIEVGCE
ncbi:MULTISPECIES: protein-glutamate methylesterase/protein-glutamine glutaminase [Plesiomonas]|uniref:Protein-glutamate methylesterase/protein-glutamine glutaminase n=4 Tax=Plesiomonas shigelloides TaxID=703 RepID=R8AVP5_PLESH|nr:MULTISPECIES: chemotaxis response regulator protein-glutamate methylesterase [Plesiomonas]EON90398.1 chemotaxis-specific methylesterase [Plesiomonas shigelloides 302-73]KAB7659687.1 chemotaxis-specific protein-glutamate methyltransferase CheB [Plesiomonas shigelloides]KAB7666556.1 chemotaxis-specific protein-glutamate methyltransferase CheB [Plesiomonas shigelloides]KAB7678188.1 chemotaxis-specific protein-glutamate methyltransferase CheB [Plesiomonas shigelloides]KAB7684603.1 chemotaxis-sp